MRWNQSDRKVLTIIAIVGVLLYVIYKGMQSWQGPVWGPVLEWAWRNEWFSKG